MKKTSLVFVVIIIVLALATLADIAITLGRTHQ